MEERLVNAKTKVKSDIDIALDAELKLITKVAEKYRNRRR